MIFTRNFWKLFISIVFVKASINCFFVCTYCNSISHEMTNATKRINLTLLNKIRTMLFIAKLNKKFWVEVVIATVYLYNRTSHSTLEFKSLYEARYQKQSNLSNIRIWDFLTYNKEHLVKKLDARAKSCILIDYDTIQYKLFDLRTKRTFWSRDINILEGVFLNTYDAKNNMKEEISDFAYDENIDFLWDWCTIVW